MDRAELEPLFDTLDTIKDSFTFGAWNNNPSLFSATLMTLNGLLSIYLLMIKESIISKRNQIGTMNY